MNIENLSLLVSTACQLTEISGKLDNWIMEVGDCCYSRHTEEVHEDLLKINNAVEKINALLAIIIKEERKELP